MVRCIFFFLIFCTSGLFAQAPYVLLVSFDGFRYDYVQRYDLPNVKKFIEEGSQAEALIPSFPSKTFPNHYTIVTGLYPGHHGLVDNNFYDPARQQVYGMRHRDRVEDSYFYGGTPLWKLAKQNGLKSASYFWVGSEVSQPENRPDYYYLYNDTVSFDKQIQQVVEWLKLPENDRPHFITLYFPSPDHESHEFGPFAEETKQTLLRMDSVLGKIMAGVESTGLKVNLILVSDHGMKEMDATSDTFIFLDEVMNLDHHQIKTVNGGTQTHIYTTTEHQHDSLYRILKSVEKHFKVVEQKEFPSRWHYNHPRSGDLLIVSEPGYYIRERDRKKSMQRTMPNEKFGAHGFDPGTEMDMRGIFYANGPNIRKGKTIPAFENIHIYPLIAKILGLPLPEIDGKESVLRSIYKK